MQNVLKGLSGLALLDAVSAANTAAATSAWIDVKGYEGIITLVLSVGTITGTLTFTFEEADNVSGDNNVAVVPIEGAIAQITTANDNVLILRSFDARRIRSHLQVIGTVATGPAPVAYSLIGLSKY